MNDVKLNIGSGSTVIEGWTPIDRKFGTEAYPLKYADNSVDEIRCAHLLEHFSFAEGIEAVRDWCRALKPGGRIRISVPDMDKIGKMQDCEERRFFLMGGQTNADDFHRSAYDEKYLSDLMTKVGGLKDIKRWESGNTDTASHPCSLNLEGIKPKASSDKAIKIAAVMSIPRIGWNDSWGSVLEALSPFRIPVRRFTGVFWGQCMQRVFNDCVRDDLDWILTIDYDSMFTAQHVDKLIGRFGENPHIDALAPLQCRRADDFPLVTCLGKQEVETNGEAIKATTAHFGLTLLRVDALRTVPKPWFKAEPDASGEWGNDRLDDDIWFWHVWRKAGHTIYVDPEVRIGHLEVMVSEFDESMKVRRMHVDKWRTENGMKVEKCS